MYKQSTILIILGAILAGTSAQVIYSGPCPENIQTVDSLDLEKYLGSWYEYGKYPVYFENEGKCVTAKYTLNADGTVRVQNSLVNENSNIYEDIIGSATIVSPGKLFVKFPVSPAYNVTTNYWILDTDYDNYATVYSCTPLNNNSHSTIVWILTRAQIPSATVIDKAASALKKNNVSLLPLKITNQISCDDVKQQPQ
ncbi:apolipoprotein D-like [Musca vetustissima]|uniref:apolipoprotein D-like n=1 Tax=Musca vetustissima TaxID=27455 RepID=UPI002AB6228B|nr:apolipoprotein D-like [Musca vetustissima]